MRCKTILFRGMVALTVGSIFAPHALAAGPITVASAQARPVRDLALGQGGLMRGQLISSTGAPVAGSPISLRLAGKEVAATKTNADGSFALTGLRGGTYEVIAGQAHAVYRAWTTDAAPPSATASALIVRDDNLTRGQSQQPVGGGWEVVGAIGGVGLIGGGVYAIMATDSGS